MNCVFKAYCEDITGFSF